MGKKRLFLIVWHVPAKVFERLYLSIAALINNNILYNVNINQLIFFLKEQSSNVEKRFYDLNSRMTRMVLATIPQKKKPDPVADAPDTQEEDDQ